MWAGAALVIFLMCKSKKQKRWAVRSGYFPTAVGAIALYAKSVGAVNLAPEQINILRGSVGPQGNPRPQGPQGPIGLTGATGATGAQGPIGLPGPSGATG